MVFLLEKLKLMKLKPPAFKKRKFIKTFKYIILCVCNLIVQSNLLYSQTEILVKIKPQYKLNPPTTQGGYSVTLVNGDDTISGLIKQQCNLTLAAIGVVKVTSTAINNSIEIPLDKMAASANYNFGTDIYKILRLRIKADKKVEGTFYIDITTSFEGKSTSFTIPFEHVTDKWAVHSLDFSKEKLWIGNLTNIKLRLLPDEKNIGNQVLIDQIELVTEDLSDKTFEVKPVLMNIIQRIKTEKGYKSVVEDISKFKDDAEPTPEKGLDGRIYYFSNKEGTNRVKINRYYNTNNGDYLDDINDAPKGYVLDDNIGFVWTKKYPGMSAVIRLVNKQTGLHSLAVSTEKLDGYKFDKNLGYAYARSEKPLQEYEFDSDKLDDILYIKSGKVRFGVNLDHGAAGWHWYHGDKQMVNINDFGRQMQLSYYTNKLNPSEVGFGRGQVGNTVAQAYTIGNSLVTRTVPFDWNFKNVLRDEGNISHPDLVPGIILGKDVTFGILGHAELAKWTAYLHTPIALDKNSGGSQLEIISNHPTADMSYRANIDFDGNGKLFISETRESLIKDTGEGTFYNYPKSGFGGNISALGAEDNQLAFGLMVGTYSDAGTNKNLSNINYTFAGEERTHSSRHVNISANTTLGAKFGSPYINNTTAQRSVMRSPTVAGDNRYIVYIMSGTVAEVKAWMQDLYNHRKELEW